MRYKGVVKEWQADRGFGFLATAELAGDVFVHRSALPSADAIRPGQLYTFEIKVDAKGRRQAIGLQRVELSLKRRPASARPRIVPTALVMLCLLVAGVWLYRRVHPAMAPQATTTLAAATRGQRSISAAPARLSEVAPAAMTTAFHCDGRTYCPQMRSCAEARYFLAHCPGVTMDGNHDGTPCEQQWCGTSWAE